MSFTVGGSIHVTAHRREEVKAVFQVDKPIQILVVSSEFTNCDVLKDIINDSVPSGPNQVKTTSSAYSQAGWGNDRRQGQQQRGGHPEIEGKLL